MPIPKDILAVERPKNTVVKMRLGRYLVIKRTSKRVNGKAMPVDLGTIGEIIDGKYVEIRTVPKKQQRQIDIKDYGEFALCNKAAGDLLQQLAAVFDIKTAKQLYVIAFEILLPAGLSLPLQRISARHTRLTLSPRRKISPWKQVNRRLKTRMRKIPTCSNMKTATAPESAMRAGPRGKEGPNEEILEFHPQ